MCTSPHPSCLPDEPGTQGSRRARSHDGRQRPDRLSVPRETDCFSLCRLQRTLGTASPLAVETRDPRPPKIMALTATGTALKANCYPPAFPRAQAAGGCWRKLPASPCSLSPSGDEGQGSARVPGQSALPHGSRSARSRPSVPRETRVVPHEAGCPDGPWEGPAPPSHRRPQEGPLGQPEALRTS